MTASNFHFLAAAEWPAVFESVAKAEALAHPDARRLLLRPPCARDRLDLLAMGAIRAPRQYRKDRCPSG